MVIVIYYLIGGKIKKNTWIIATPNVTTVATSRGEYWGVFDSGIFISNDEFVFFKFSWLMLL